MKHFAYTFTTSIAFDIPVQSHTFLLRCMPRPEMFQHIIEERLHIPDAVFSHGTDSFGNRVQGGHCIGTQNNFVFTSSGLVGARPYRIPDTAHGMYLVQTPLTSCSSVMLDFSQHITPQRTALKTALAFSQAVHRHMTYVTGATSIETTAATSFEQGSGVCQDYAHILIALCRASGMYARYAQGFMLGEGATHAWVEIFSDGIWYGIDPTNDALIELGYIKVAHGRDSHDCSVNRGLIHGITQQHTQISLKVEMV